MQPFLTGSKAPTHISHWLIRHKMSKFYYQYRYSTKYFAEKVFDFENEKKLALMNTEEDGLKKWVLWSKKIGCLILD